MTDVVAGRFALCDPIARGGSGVVWRAFDRKTQQFCAAKVLRRRDAGDLLRFVREQSVRLAHPNVLTPYSWAAEDAHVVIASDLVDGGSLSTFISDYGPLAEGTVAMILGQLLLALEHVHAAGLVHRDVKPANLLLDATGTGPIQVRLGDFGLAMGAGDAHLTEVGTVVGTPGYLPPELMRGGVTPNPRHDLYAAGRVASALAAGIEPTEVGGPVELSALRAGPLRGAVAALTAVDATLRPASARAALDLLRPVPVDPLPLTRDGDPIEVLHQLPPLSASAIAEAEESTTQPLDVRAVPAATLVQPAEPAKPGRRRRRNRLILSGIGVAAALAVSVPVALTLGSGGNPSTPPGTSTVTPPSTGGRTSGGKTSPSGTSTQTGGVVPQTVKVGDRCTFKEEGNVVRAAGGGNAVCTRRSDLTYVWEKA